MQHPLTFQQPAHPPMPHPGHLAPPIHNLNAIGAGAGLPMDAWRGMTPEKGAWASSSLIWGAPSSARATLPLPAVPQRSKNSKALRLGALMATRPALLMTGDCPPPRESSGKYLATIRTLSRAAMDRHTTGINRTERCTSVNAKPAKSSRRKAATASAQKVVGNRNAATGELEWPKDILESGTLLRDFPNVEATGLHTVRSVLKISSRVGLKRQAGKRTIEDDDLDSQAIATHTRFLQSYIEKLHLDYMKITGSTIVMLPMYFHQFTRFLLKLGFRDEFIVKRMFETFDVDHNDQLNFVELLVGLSFFMDREQRVSSDDAPLNDSPVFIEFCTKFFDLDGHERMSKFKLYKVCSTCLSKSEATLFADVIYEVISGTVSTLTLQQFKEILKGAPPVSKEAPKLRHILRLLMVLQGCIPGTDGYEDTHCRLREVIDDWTTLKKAGRSVSMELLVRELQGASDVRVAELSEKAEEYQQARRGMDAVYASYYVQVFRAVIGNGKQHVAAEHSRILGTLAIDSSKFQVSEKARELLMVETAILEGFHECLGMPIDAKMTRKFHTPIVSRFRTNRRTSTRGNNMSRGSVKII